VKHDPILDGLNPQQLEAATHIEGPILVFAGAGSGKTRVLTRRIAYLVRSGVSAHRILAITFTNKAAQEMKERAKALLPRVDPWVSTFHSFCAWMLRQYGQNIGVSRSFVIYDTQDQVATMKRVLSDMALDDKRYHPSAMLATISNAKNDLLSAEQYARQVHGFFEQKAAEVYARYQRQLAANDALDFDDLLTKSVELLRNSPDTLKYYHDRFSYILVDEYQDTNHAQYVLVNMLSAKHKNIFVVGDDDQNIYSFRGASSKNIMQFEKDYPGAKIVRLEQNYRSTQNILDVAYHVIKNNRSRVDKRLWTQNGEGPRVMQRRLDDEYEEAGFVAHEVARLRQEGYAFKDFAVLYRTHAQSRVIEEVFMEKTVPYVIVGGIRFYERKEIRDILAYLRLVSGARDALSVRRIINVPRRGIGEVTLGRLEQYAQRNDISVLQALEHVDSIEDMGEGAKAKLRSFGQMINRVADLAAGKSVYNTTQIVLKESGYLGALIEDGSPEAQSRAENIQEFLSATLEFDRQATGGLAEFLESVSLVSDIDTVDDKKDAVVLMTLHSAKGLEFPVVFLVGLEEGVFPHMRSMMDPLELEEERRLCYVGMTRAQRRLYLTYTGTRTLWGRTESALPSRFLSEIPRELLDVEQQAAAGRVSPRQERRMFAARHASDSFAGETEFCPGEKVIHPTLGSGTVVSQKGSGPDAEIGVAFPDKGVKILIARYANLKKE